MSITIRLIQAEKELETVAVLAEEIWSRTYKDILSIYFLRTLCGRGGEAA